jgi:hypothetical protein
MIGSVGAFEEGAESWTLYQERLEQFFLANDIADVKKRAVLLSICGKSTYQLVSSLLAPQKPADASYASICEKLKNHYDPKPPELVLRSRFYDRSRRAGESVADFLADLRRLAKDCNFGSLLESRLRDRLALGINNDATKALSIAQAHEAATNSSQQLESQDAVHAIKGAGPSRRCFRCLSQRHPSAKCPFIQSPFILSTARRSATLRLRVDHQRRITRDSSRFEKSRSKNQRNRHSSRPTRCTRWRKGRGGCRPLKRRSSWTARHCRWKSTRVRQCR